MTNDTTRRTRGFRTSILAGASLAALIAAPGFAQETTDDAGEARAQDRIVVTGSRIARDPNLTGSTPVQSLDAEAIRSSGELNIADIVNDIPALISSLTADNSVTGANSLNLRGLGGERTLTLVNGRRHVAGFRGTQAVDTGTIPRALVENVEVTTGGASAIYGADAVTGVVNFILKDDFEGFELNTRAGISGEGDAENYAVDAVCGRNFHSGRGNVVMGLTWERDSELAMGDRDWSRDNGIATVETNPDFLTDPTAPRRAIVNDPRFWLTSQEGSIAPGFGGRGTTYVDINGNSIADCQESEGGRVGFLAGCWLTNPDGTVRVNQDGTVLNGLWGIGGDGGRVNFNRDSLLPQTDRQVVNLNSNYDITDNFRVFFEAKYVNARSEFFEEQDSFYDTLFIRPDNAFIPSQLDPVVAVTGGLLLTQDPLDWSDNNPSIYTRETLRFVGGFQWEPVQGHTIEVSINDGTFRQESDTTGLYLDRVFAAIDAVETPGGDIVCRSDLDPNASYEIDYFAGGNGFANGSFSSDRYYSFTPGDGQCQPLNPFGTYSASAAAQNFVTSDLNDSLQVEQTVFSVSATGAFDVLGFFLDDAIGYAAGAEYREESSNNKLDPLTLGILPGGTSFTPGALVSTVDPFLNSFTSIDNTQQFNTRGSYDVSDVYAEIQVPIFRDRPFARDLTLDAAIRFADYSTVGDATTWKVGGTWAPVSDISFRATLSEAVRAPNISELFDPKLPIFVNATADPCDPGNVGGGPNPSQREANCITDLQAAGVPLSQIQDGGGNYIWANPLTGRFSGVSGGNPNLDVETAETFTIGAVFTPTFIEGLSLTVDYWDITIEDAISSVDAGDILDGCIDSSNYPALDFCNAFTRRADGGLNFLESGQINFARLEASGYDFAINYGFDIGANGFGVSLVGSHQEKLNRFFNPLDSADVNPDLEEVQLPELSGNLTVSWDRGPWRAALRSTYQSRQFATGIQDFDDLGPAGFFDEVYIFDANMNYEFSDAMSFYGGINNIADEEPFATQTAWPVGPRGRFFFFGATYTR
jgi:outer membrane receptor protein involved in Fe transport